MGHYDDDYDLDWQRAREREQASRKMLFNIMKSFSSQLYQHSADKHIPKRFLESLQDMMNHTELDIKRHEN